MHALNLYVFSGNQIGLQPVGLHTYIGAQSSLTLNNNLVN